MKNRPGIYKLILSIYINYIYNSLRKIKLKIQIRLVEV